MITGYTVPEIWCMADVIAVFHFELFFTLSPNLQPEKYKFQKNEKKPWRYYHFTLVYKKS